jgi:transposase InsO family protein
VASCEVCQQAKPERVKNPGLLATLPTPKKAWRDVLMDFIEGNPKSDGYAYTLVVVDRFSKYAHFVPLVHPYTATSVATTYMNHVFKLHGVPKTIVSDRDKIFTSIFWKELHNVTGIELLFSSPYHLETDGKTERVNQCLEGYLRCFVHGCPRKWIRWFPLASFWYNTSKHSSVGTSHFKVVYEEEPLQLGIDRL